MRYLFILLGLAFLLTAFEFRDTFIVSGKITNEKGSPVPFASITEKGTTNATSTDVNGEFTLTVNSRKPVILITAVGYASREIALKNDGKPVNISLKTQDASLQEVVVVGYDTKSKRSKVHSNAAADMAVVSAPAQGVRVRGVAPDGEEWRYNNDFNTEGYDVISENKFLTATGNPLSTFSIDVDAASYSNVRRFLQRGQLPPAGAVRIEEMINYFKYEYPQPSGDDPFSINTEISECPWNKKHRLVMIGLQGKKIATDNLPASNLVFLVDVSGSMDQPDKLPLVQSSMKLLTDQLRQQDKVSIVVYAGSAGVVLPSTSGAEKNTIKKAIDQLRAGGSTAGGEGIRLAYKIAKENFVKDGNNRVILCTDGDFNVGVSSHAALEELIESQRQSGVFLTVLGYGTGNYQDGKMQLLADKGNGNHAYIDNLSEARKVLVTEFGGTLFTIAKDVKLQIEFNPAKVSAYRLIGYENRILAKEDFNNDKKDAGDLGSGHTVTALYEVIPAGVQSEFIEKTDDLKYQSQPNSVAGTSPEIMTIKFRYKQPDQDSSKLIVHAVNDNHVKLSQTSENFRFAAAVAAAGMVLRNSKFKQDASFDQAWQLAKNALGNDAEGYRSEFLKLIRNAQSIASRKSEEDEDVGVRD
ncbi:MAG TPA: von Willebrand factor type A domain-containing protein [Chitinophagaceae bacterium]|nr:von Willebrand factor type A domain-containing protein [Chitinophagaceae bacterium]